MYLKEVLDKAEQSCRIPQVASKEGATRQTNKRLTIREIHRNQLKRLSKAETNKGEMNHPPTSQHRVIPNIPNEFDEFEKRVLTGQKAVGILVSVSGKQFSLFCLYKRQCRLTAEQWVKTEKLRNPVTNTESLILAQDERWRRA